jgi:hypothetical protein
MDISISWTPRLTDTPAHGRPDSWTPLAHRQYSRPIHRYVGYHYSVAFLHDTLLFMVTQKVTISFLLSTSQLLLHQVELECL